MGGRWGVAGLASAVVLVVCQPKPSVPTQAAPSVGLPEAEQEMESAGPDAEAFRAAAGGTSPIQYRVVHTQSAGAGEAEGLVAERDGRIFEVIPPRSTECFSIHRERDLDGDGLLDAIVIQHCGGNGFPKVYYFVAGTSGKYFAAQELAEDWNLVDLDTWQGRPSLALVSNNEGMNTLRPEQITWRFVFEKGRAVAVQEERAVEQEALADLRAEQFDGAQTHEERSISFDLDDDGRPDILAGTLFERWGRIQWHVRFADGRVTIEHREHECKRIGVLRETTLGHHDLVCDFDTRLRWNGDWYVDDKGN